MEQPLPKATGLEAQLRELLANTWLNPFHIAKRSLWQAFTSIKSYPNGILLDVGCGKKPYAKLFDQVTHYVGLEAPSTVSRSSVIDVFGLAENLPFRAALFDTVLCTEVIEHVPEPKHVLQECHRVLKQDGILILSTPQTWGLHEVPHDYYRYTEFGLRYLAQATGFRVIKVFPTCGVFATVGQRTSSAIFYLFGYRRWIPLQALAILICGLLQITSQMLDNIFHHSSDTLDNVLVARKC